jgi:hypothetical protein
MVREAGPVGPGVSILSGHTAVKGSRRPAARLVQPLALGLQARRPLTASLRPCRGGPRTTVCAFCVG